MPRNVLVLGGGAPNFTLNTGALLAFEEAGFRFDAVSGAGGGGAVALNYLAPKGMDRIQALHNSVNLGVSDAIYRVIPMNYKVFMKGGVLADAYRALLKRLPGYGLVMNQLHMTKRQKFLSDLVQAWWAMTTPSILTPLSKGLCAHAPFINEMVDFDKLKTVPEEVFLSSYCLSSHKMVTFRKSEITFEHFGASLSYPFIYPPTRMNKKYYIEGATEDAFNFDGIMDYVRTAAEKIDNIVVLDSFGCEEYLQVPPNLWQAWGQSLISPLVPLDRVCLKLLRQRHAQWNEQHPDRATNLMVLSFKIPKGWAPTALDWSSSNLHRLFKLGYKEGRQFLIDNHVTLRGVPAEAA